MRRFLAGLIFAGFTWPAGAGANDLSEALNFTSEIMEEDQGMVGGFEDWMDYDPEEALPLLLSREVVPYMPPGDYPDNQYVGYIPRTDFFEQLGGTRLNYQALAGIIDEAANKTGLPAALIDAVIRTESGYRVRAVSSRGAQGLMQLLPGTAKTLGVNDAFDPRDNINGGARYLKQLYDRFGSLRLALAAYNAGPGAVAKHRGVPPYPQTQQYVAVVLQRYQKSPIRKAGPQ